MKHTVESMMALAYKLKYAKSVSYAESADKALSAALTEALQAAQPVAHPDYTLLRQALEALLPHKSNALRWYTPVDAAIDALRARLESV
jgi:hypothetical protein